MSPPAPSSTFLVRSSRRVGAIPSSEIETRVRPEKVPPNADCTPFPYPRIPTSKYPLIPSSFAHLNTKFCSRVLSESATNWAFVRRVATSPPAAGSAIEPDWSIRNRKQVGFARLISALCDIPWLHMRPIAPSSSYQVTLPSGVYSPGIAPLNEVHSPDSLETRLSLVAHAPPPLQHLHPLHPALHPG